jgi:arabinogalactan oligomer / maltooligosaccharide transport system permease protein
MNSRSARWRRWRRIALRRFPKHLLIWIIIAYALFPVLWIFSASVNPTSSLSQQKLIPDHITWDHYRTLFSDPNYPFATWLLNTLKISGITAIGTVILCALSGYAFSRFRFRGRRVSLLSLLLIQMFPQMLAIVAIFFILRMIGDYAPALGINTHLGLIMVYLGGAMGFNTYLMKGYFDTVPRSLEESAMVDGATPFQAFLRIMIPLVRPILAVIFIIQFITSYSEFILASVLLRGSDQLTLSVGLRFFTEQAFERRWGPFAAGAIVGGASFLLIFLPLQRFIVSGLTQGSVKE